MHASDRSSDKPIAQALSEALANAIASWLGVGLPAIRFVEKAGDCVEGEEGEYCLLSRAIGEFCSGNDGGGSGEQQLLSDLERCGGFLLQTFVHGRPFTPRRLFRREMG